MFAIPATGPTTLRLTLIDPVLTSAGVTAESPDGIVTESPEPQPSSGVVLIETPVLLASLWLLIVHPAEPIVAPVASAQTCPPYRIPTMVAVPGIVFDANPVPAMIFEAPERLTETSAGLAGLSARMPLMFVHEVPVLD